MQFINKPDLAFAIQGLFSVVEGFLVVVVFCFLGVFVVGFEPGMHSGPLTGL